MAASAAAAATATATAASAAAVAPCTWASLWSYVSLDFVTERYIREWQFVPGHTALSSLHVFWIVPIYLGVIHLLKWHVKQRGEAYDLKPFVILHNALLSIGSAILFIALGSELVSMMRHSSFLSVFCDDTGRWTSGRVYFLYYLNYLFKFAELWDTCLLALRGKPTPFLHVYHHAATLILCWSQLYSQSCMQWVVIIINLFVHIIMYQYYALHALGIDVWWKKYLTMTQIVQFVVALVACFAALGSRLAHHAGYTALPECWGSYPGAFFGIGILLSYLVLFMQLYRAAYSKKKAEKKAVAAVATANGTNGHAHTDAADASKPKSQ